MTQPHPCLLRIGNTSSKYRYFPLLQNQVKIGRSDDATYTIMSEIISRCHAIIEKQEDNTWTIMDNKSLNGISVNGQRLQALVPCPLKNGDTVQLGVKLLPSSRALFMYRFFSSLKVRREPSGSKRKQSCKAPEDAVPSKRFKGSSETPTQSLAKSPQKAGGSNTRNDAEDNGGSVEQGRLAAAYEGQLKMLAQQLRQKEQEKSAIAQQLQQERQQRQAMEERQKLQEKKVSQLDAKQRQLMKEKTEAEAQLRKQLENRLHEQEQMLRTQMQQKLESLAAEKNHVEKCLQLELEKAVQEKNREQEKHLQVEKKRLQKVIATKELEQRTLERQLAESHAEKERAQADTLAAREALLSEFADTMERELQCAVCSELFVKATSLNCAHVFCALCIRQWMLVKKECPNCRTEITSQTRSVILDSYIDRMVEQLSAEMKQRRAELVAERQEAESKMDETENRERAGPSGATAGQHGQGRRQGRDSRRTGRRQRVRQTRRAPTVVIPTPDPTNENSSSEAQSDNTGSGNSVSEVVIMNRDEEQTTGYVSAEYESSSPEPRYRSRYWNSDSDSSSDDIYLGNAFNFGRCERCRTRHWTDRCHNCGHYRT